MLTLVKGAYTALGQFLFSFSALAYLLHSDVYSDAFILHERSSLDPSHPLIPYRKDSIEYPMESEPKSIKDCRKDLHETWLSNFKFQPLWKIRNYFGEKIALYFAWLGEDLLHFLLFAI